LAELGDMLNADVQVLYGGEVFNKHALDDGTDVTLRLLEGSLGHQQLLELSGSTLDLRVDLSPEIGNGGGAERSTDLLKSRYNLFQVLNDLLKSVDVDFAVVANFGLEPFDDVLDATGEFQRLDGKSLFNLFAAGTDELEGLSQVVGDSLDLVAKFLGVVAILSKLLEVLELDEDVAKGGQEIVEYAVEGTVVVSSNVELLKLVLGDVSQFLDFRDNVLDIQYELSAQFVDWDGTFDIGNLLKGKRDFGKLSDDLLKDDVVICIVLDFSFQHLDDILDGLSEFSNLDDQSLSELLAVRLSILEVCGQAAGNGLDLDHQSPGVLSVKNDLEIILNLHLKVLETSKEIDKCTSDESDYASLTLLDVMLTNEHQFLDFNCGILNASGKLHFKLVGANYFNAGDSLLKRHLDLFQVGGNLTNNVVKASIFTSRDLRMQFVDDDVNDLRESACLVDKRDLSLSVVGNDAEHSGKTVSDDLDLKSQFSGGLTDLGGLVVSLELVLYVLEDNQVLDKYATYYTVQVTLDFLHVVLGKVGQFSHFSGNLLKNNMEAGEQFVSRSGSFVYGYLFKRCNHLLQVGYNLLDNTAFASVDSFNFEPFDDAFDVVCQSAGLDFNLLPYLYTAGGDVLEVNCEVVGDSLDLESQVLSTLTILASVVHAVNLGLLALESSNEVVEDAIESGVEELTLSLLEVVLSNPQQFLDFGGGFLDVSDEVHLELVSGSDIFDSSNLLKSNNNLPQVGGNLLGKVSAVYGGVAYSLEPFDDGFEVLGEFVALLSKNLSGVGVVKGNRFNSGS